MNGWTGRWIVIKKLNYSCAAQSTVQQFIQKGLVLNAIKLNFHGKAFAKTATQRSQRNN